MTGEPVTLTLSDYNEALRPACRRLGQCVCVFPMRLVVNAAGLDCSACGQKVTDFYYSPEAKQLRGQILAAAFPQLGQQDGPG